MSLPDIEAYIDQKIPGEHVTPEMLIALPRKPREGVEADAEEGESIGEIFKEVREARAAEDAKRGGGRGAPPRGRSGERSSSAPRSGSGTSTGERPARGPRPPRKPRVEGDAVVGATPDAAAVPVAQAAPQAPKPATGIEGDGKPPRKRRRRRHGRPLEGAEAVTTQPAAPASTTTTAPATGGDKPSLISRIGRRLKSLVGG